MMARKLFVSGLAVCMVAVVAVGVSLASASSKSGARVWGAPTGMAHFAQAAAAASADPTITVIAKHQTETDVDEPPTGFSQGDEVTIGSALFNRAGARVGHLDVHGAFTALFRNSARGQFEFTATLRHGAITATGVATFSDTSTGFTAAVTGGTGAYQKTDGWVQVIFITATTTKFVYHLTD
jgi:hypothetical protein